MLDYQLFIGRYKELQKEEYTYYSPSRGYMLVYTNKCMECMGFKKVLPEKECELPEEEKAWLTKTRFIVSATVISLSSQEMINAMNIFVDNLEKALKEEKQQ